MKWFLLHPNVRVDASTLSHLLWPENGSDSTNRLHVAVHHLRHALEPELGVREQSKFIRLNKTGHYWFDTNGVWWTDVAEVESLAAAARRARKSRDNVTAIAHYERLLDYYAHGFLPEDLFDDRFDDDRAVHEVNQQAVQHELLTLYITEGLIHKALLCAMLIQEYDPCSEEAMAAIIDVCMRHGNGLAAGDYFATYIDAVGGPASAADHSSTAERLWDQARRADPDR
ncbi:helix-turn-helix domain-containing protein [Tsukamurella sp. 8F]|nr:MULTISPECIES: helix-turn-helix domain-containing protein [unclassified Tsukamurella]MDF0531686.1 helix-turn-helix domain-containing protein [Tsukamurella sp. 8J]MDF0588932.1 helix-turn-helix domain-containing protein [Tsukamurella sp. 8F]